MKKVFLIIIVFQSLSNIYAQHTEFECSLNSGLFSYSGSSTVSSSILISYGNNKVYTNNPYGSDNGLCDGLSLTLKRVTKINLIYGLDAGFETLRSRVSIFGIEEQTFEFFGIINVKGQDFLNTNFLNFNPFMGYRFILKNVSLDLVGGFDLGYILSSTESGNYIATNGSKYSSSSDQKNISLDVRPRIQISANYKRFGIYIGYSYGLANYLSGKATSDMSMGSPLECYARLIRFGVTYRFI